MITPIRSGRGMAPASDIDREVVRGRRGNPRAGDRWIDRGEGRGRATPPRDGLQAGALPCVERVHELRDLVHDHLGPGRVLHRVLLRLAERWPDRGVDRLAGAVLLHPHGWLLD